MVACVKTSLTFLTFYTLNILLSFYLSFLILVSKYLTVKPINQYFCTYLYLQNTVLVKLNKNRITLLKLCCHGGSMDLLWTVECHFHGSNPHRSILHSLSIARDPRLQCPLCAADHGGLRAILGCQLLARIEHCLKYEQIDSVFQQRRVRQRLYARTLSLVICVKGSTIT